jgi:hypothetical protein
MLIAVFADSHGELDGMCAAIDGHRPDMVLHLGDYARDAESLEKYYPGLDIRYVRGNCDGWYSDAPEFLRFSADGVGIYMTHGHRQNVKMTLDPLANTVHFSGAQLGLFGHTHCSEYKKMGDVTLFNPGSAGRGRRSWGLITVKGTEFTCTLMDM